VKVILSSDTIAKATRCLCEGNTYIEGWEKNYDSHVTRALYCDNVDMANDPKMIYNLMCEKEKILLHKAGSKMTLFDLHKFMMSFLMENLPFDLPHIIYINIVRNLKDLGGLDDVYYSTLANKLLLDQEVYHVFNKMDKDSKHTLIVHGSVVTKQQKFSKAKLKAMKVALEQTLKEAPKVDMEAISK